VHQQDLTRIVRIAVRLDLGREIECGIFSDLHTRWDSIAYVLDLGPNPDFFECFGMFGRAELEVAIQWSAQEQRAYVPQIEFRGDNASSGPVAPLATLRSDPAGHRTTLSVYDDNPSLFSLAERKRTDTQSPMSSDAEDDNRTILGQCLAICRSMCHVDGDEAFYLAGHFSGLRLSEPEPVVFHSRDGRLSTQGHNDPPTAGWRFVSEVSFNLGFLLQIIHGRIRHYVETLRCIGPLRELPARNRRPPKTPDRSRWASGLGAWDRLAADDDALLTAVNGWLGDERRLNTGYHLHAKRYKEVDLSNPLLCDLLSGRAFDDVAPDSRMRLEELPTQTRLLVIPVGEELELEPSDVGVGISQVIPVIVAALDGEGYLNAIEQPELHVHPRLQAELADLFIEGALNLRQRFMIETHSEHLILRLQRRIRERVLAANDVQILYVDRVNGTTRVATLRLDDEGDFIDNWPGGFFPERLNELR
jgi:hypothetical protein